MKDWNKLIQRQLKKTFGSLENVPENIQPFLQVISDTYDHYDKDRKMLERSIELSSEEMKELHQILRKETEENNKKLLKKLNESLTLLNEGTQDLQIDSDYLTLHHIADTLKKETLKRKTAEEQRTVTEKELIYANRIFRVISQINQMIVRAKSEDEIYSNACKIVVQYGKFKTSWVSAITKIKTKPVIASDGAIEDITLLAAATGSLQQQVLKTNTFYVCNHIGAEHLLGEQKTSIVNLGYGSCIVLPIRQSGKIVATFNLYAQETGFFNATEIALLEEATSDISFALDVLEKDRQRTITEQKLRASEWRLRQAQSIAHLGSWSLDFSTGIALWSKEALKIYGIDTSEVEQSYESWLSYIHPEDLPFVLENTKKGRHNLSSMAFFHRIIRKDGVVRHLYSQSDFKFDEMNKPIGLYGVAHDITEIKEKEQALLNSQADLQAIFNSTSEGFILTELDCKVKTFNEKIREIILSNTEREIQIGDNFTEFAHPIQKETYEHILGEVTAGKTLHYQLPFDQKNKTVKWFDFTVSPVYTSNTVTGLVITSSDITKHKLAELKLVESEKRYSNLFQLNPLPMWVYDQETLRFLDVNQAAITHYGYSRREFLSMTIKDIRPAEDLQLLEKAIFKNKSTRSPVYHQSFRHQKKNGDIIQVEVQSNHLLYKGIVAKIILAKDVTERFSYVKAIEQQNEKLKEISWLQSHVIRAPLTRIMALVPMIESDTETPEEKKRILEYLRLSANELDDVIMNISDKTNIIDLMKSANQ